MPAMVPPLGGVRIVGQPTDDILLERGVTSVELDELASRRVIRRPGAA